MSIRLMIAGFGRTAQEHHLPHIMAQPSLRLKAVYDVSEQARAVASQTEGCVIYSDYRQALKASDIDLVIILTRNDTHCDMACDFLLSGKNVLITKPWALNIEQAHQMVQAACQSGKKLLPWLPCRWSSDLRAIKEIISSGEIGKVYMVRRCFSTFGKRCDWQTQRAFGGGYLLNWGPHLIDQPMQLIDEEIISVYAITKQLINPGDTEDMFYAVMTTSSGVTLVSEFNIGADVCYDWLVQGDKGTITVKGDDIEIYSAIHPAEIDPSAYRGSVDIKRRRLEGYCSQYMYGNHDEIYEHIAQVIAGRQEYSITLESACNLTRVLDAVRDSAETGEVIWLKARNIKGGS